MASRAKKKRLRRQQRKLTKAIPKTPYYDFDSKLTSTLTTNKPVIDKPLTADDFLALANRVSKFGQ